jgi:hypothetical protein
MTMDAATCTWCGDTASVLFETQLLCGRCFGEQSARQPKTPRTRTAPVEDALNQVRALLPALAHWLRRLDEMWTAR